MMGLRTLLLLCGVAASHAGTSVPHSTPPQDRCARNSITEVSCANVVTEDSLVPHPDDCNLFYYCIQPNLPPVCRECPSNLHFNPILHVCDWPYRAGCQMCTWPMTTDSPTSSSTPTIYTTYPTEGTWPTTTDRPSTSSEPIWETTYPTDNTTDSNNATESAYNSTETETTVDYTDGYILELLNA